MVGFVYIAYPSVETSLEILFEPPLITPLEVLIEALFISYPLNK